MVLVPDLIDIFDLIEPFDLIDALDLALDGLDLRPGIDVLDFALEGLDRWDCPVLRIPFIWEGVSLYGMVGSKCSVLVGIMQVGSPYPACLSNSVSCSLRDIPLVGRTVCSRFNICWNKRNILLACACWVIFFSCFCCCLLTFFKFNFFKKFFQEHSQVLDKRKFSAENCKYFLNHDF